MPVRPRRQRHGIAPLSMDDDITLEIGPAYVFDDLPNAAEVHRLTAALRGHRKRFAPTTWGVRHLMNGEQFPEPVRVGDTLDAIGCPNTTHTLPPAA
jgi:hypothetical protein